MIKEAARCVWKHVQPCVKYNVQLHNRTGQAGEIARVVRERRIYLIL